MKVIVEQCSRRELLGYIRFLEGQLQLAMKENNRVREEAQDYFDKSVMLEDTIHELGIALDNVNDILNVYHLSTLGERDDEE